MNFSGSQPNRPVRPLWLLRRWKTAAGPLACRHVPSAPFTALARFGEPRQPLRHQTNPAQLDQLCLNLAIRLGQTPQLEAVRSGEAAFVLDLPAALSLGLGQALQLLGIAPVLLFNGLYRPGSLLEGVESLPALVRYGQRLKPWQGEKGYAFLLERERAGPDHLQDFTAWQTFENRYRVSDHLFPPLPALLEGGMAALVDLRLAADELPDDLNSFYRYSARAGLDIYQANLPADWFTSPAVEQL